MDAVIALAQSKLSGRSCLNADGSCICTTVFFFSLFWKSLHLSGAVSGELACLTCCRKIPDLSWTVSAHRRRFIHLSFSVAIFHQEAKVFPNRRFQRRGRVSKLRLVASSSHDAQFRHKLLWLRKLFDIRLLIGSPWDVTSTWYVHDHKSTNHRPLSSWILKSLP